MFSTSTSPSKWATEPALEAGSVGGVADGEDFGLACGLQRVLVGGDEAEFVAEALVSARRTRRRRAGGSRPPGRRRPPARRSETSRPPSPSTSPVLNSVTRSMPFSSSSPPSALERPAW